ncbi:hypothetical protein [Geomesophilobacter sediminis]|uniref:Uncharacterized protein n=1 Tax=Geomesophilobacter sediminis TaxID=2798584 RepID=A0A8J7J7Z6_9BACT|nr:hypothetical protein [Geomesophilobacter sediminis]MBJ6725576.1 hypothetical protein [Geomesophilobacter sediminis]
MLPEENPERRANEREQVGSEAPVDDGIETRRVSFLEEDGSWQKGLGEVKAAVARTIRDSARERRTVSSVEDLAEWDDYLRYGQIEVRALLEEMAGEADYQDLKCLTTATGLVYFYSQTFLTEEEAARKGTVEEAKSIIAGAIRADSLEKVALTPIGDIYALAPGTGAGIVDALLDAMTHDRRYQDLKQVTAAGEVYFHSDRYLVDNYAATLLLARAGDHRATIAETVREESRIYPRTTNAACFLDYKLYGIPPDELETVIRVMLGKPEFADIKRIVHPVTNAVHLYSERYIAAEHAWAMMDWEEVGRANNP